MPDYLQDSEKMFIKELIDAHLVAPNGEILDKDEYIQWLRNREESLRAQIQAIPEPGDVYDRYNANLLYKDIDVIHQMILRQTGSAKNDTESKFQNREQELINKRTIFTDAMKLLNKWKNNITNKNPKQNINNQR